MSRSQFSIHRRRGSALLRTCLTSLPGNCLHRCEVRVPSSNDASHGAAGGLHDTTAEVRPVICTVRPTGPRNAEDVGSETAKSPTMREARGRVMLSQRGRTLEEG